MTKTPDISAIIVSYNTKKLTLDAIKSVLLEGGNTVKEVIVVDNNSEDGSREELKKLEKANKIKLIANSSNTGFSKANNQGINIAKGKYVLLLNSDTYVYPGAFSKVIKFADKTPDVGVVGFKLLNSDKTVQASCGYFPTFTNAVKAYWLGQRELFNKFAPHGKFPVKVDFVVGAAFLITPKSLKKVGRLNEKYFFYFEDIDYCRRVYREGLSVYYFPGSEVMHYHGKSGTKISDSANQWRRLIPSSKIYHGPLKHYLITFVLWSGQKWQKFLKILR